MHLKRDIKIKFAFLPMKLDDGKFVWLKRYKQITIEVDSMKWTILTRFINEEIPSKNVKGKRYNVARGK